MQRNGIVKRGFVRLYLTVIKKGNIMKLTSKHEMNLTEGSIFKKLIIFALPLIATNILQLLFNVADVAVLGVFVENGDNAVAAVGATGALINLIIGLFVGLSVGANVLVARFVGSNDKERAERVVGMSMVLSVVLGVVLAVTGFFCAEIFLGWMGCDETVIGMAAKYMQIYFIGMPIILLYNFCAAILRAVGDTLRPLIYLVIAGFVNVGLNVFFILVLKKDVEGVAIATIASQAISAVLAIISLIKSDGFAHLDLRKLRFFKRELGDMVKIGLPSGVQGCVFSLSNVVIQSTINGFKQQAMTGNTIAAQFDGFIYNAMFGLALACMSFVSQNLGAKNTERIRKTVKIALMDVFVIGIVTGGIILLLARPVGKLISDDPVVLDYAWRRLLITSTTYFMCGLMDVMSNTMRGLGKTSGAMVISISGSCLFRILWVNTMCVWFPQIETLYWVYPVSWALTFAIYLAVYFPTMRRVERKLCVPTVGAVDCAEPALFAAATEAEENNANPSAHGFGSVRNRDKLGAKNDKIK